MKTTLPSYYATAFNCPNCGVYAKQEWFVVGKVKLTDRGPTKYGNLNEYSIVECEHCSEYTIW